MPEELGTKDVLEQVDVRLGNVEQDLRELRMEMNSRFDGIYQQMNSRFDGIYQQMDSRFDRVYQEMSGLRGEFENRFRAVDQRFMWLYGLLVAVLIGVAGLWFK